MAKKSPFPLPGLPLDFAAFGSAEPNLNYKNKVADMPKISRIGLHLSLIVLAAGCSKQDVPPSRARINRDDAAIDQSERAIEYQARQAKNEIYRAADEVDRVAKEAERALEKTRNKIRSGVDSTSERAAEMAEDAKDRAANISESVDDLLNRAFEPRAARGHATAEEEEFVDRLRDE
jgi:gas vesicle protein